jgi:hypothetical protein
VFSKLVVCAMMIRGRCRGLSYALDSVIALPSDHAALEMDDIEDYDPKPKRRDRLVNLGYTVYRGKDVEVIYAVVQNPCASRGIDAHQIRSSLICRKVTSEHNMVLYVDQAVEITIAKICLIL